MRDALKRNPWPEVAWGVEDKPVLLLDGKPHRVKEISRELQGHTAYVVGVNEKLFPGLCRSLRVEFLHFYELRVANLGPLSDLEKLRGLAVRWNTRLTDLSPLACLGSLKELAIGDTPKVRDLSPIAKLKQLRSLEFAGGMWNKNHAETLEPIARLPDLEELTLLNLKVDDDGLRPLAACPALKLLDVSDQFKTEDYAYLSVRLPETQCDWFAAYQQFPEPIGDKDVMVTGTRKPMLNSSADAERMQRYASQFKKMQDRFRSTLI